MPATSTDARHAELQLVSRSDDHVELAIPHTSYRMHLKLVGELNAQVGRRVRGVIEASVWKVDFVSPGGAYIDPVLGRPRRVQGRVTGHGAQGNGITISVAGCPFSATLPDRWPAADIPVGTTIAVDIHDGATFKSV